MFLVRSSDHTGPLHDADSKKKMKIWKRLVPWKGLGSSKQRLPQKQQQDCSQKLLVRSGADLTVESCSSKHASQTLLVADDDWKQDDVSSVSALSEVRFSPTSFQATRNSKQQQQEDSIPTNIEIVTVSYPEVEDEQFGNSSNEDNVETEDPLPVASVIRLSGCLDPTSIAGIVDSEAISQLDPELRARLEAIQQLSTMMGSDHPDVLFSMKYLSRLLYRRGDFAGASKIANHLQNVQSCCQL